MFLGEDLRQAFAAAERSWELQGVYLGPLSLEARPVRIRIHHLHHGSGAPRNFVFLDKAAFSALNVRRPR